MIVKNSIKVIAYLKSLESIECRVEVIERPLLETDKFDLFEKIEIDIFPLDINDISYYQVESEIGGRFDTFKVYTYEDLIELINNIFKS